VVAPTTVPREEIPQRKWPFLHNNSLKEKGIKVAPEKKRLKMSQIFKTKYK
jgi:hypothetical protein